MNKEFEHKIEEYVQLVDKALDEFLPDNGEKTVKAMRYSLFAGGKRIRPALCFAFCELFGGDVNSAVPFACAIEMIHTYSLIYDDMPCMDNDTLRRGKPTNHVVFGEDIALMAGAALLEEALGIANRGSKYGLSAEQCIAGVEELVKASGLRGIITGQVLDIENKLGLSESEIENIYKLKTSSMLEGASVLGCIAAGAHEEDIACARTYANNIGFAFQIRDDILDVTGSAKDIGKTPGKDKNGMKTTYVDVVGLEEAQKRVEVLTKSAKDILPRDKSTAFLSDLADYLCSRKK